MFVKDNNNAVFTILNIISNCPMLYFLIIETDECDTANGGCEDNCFNVPGSYYCTCDAGYGLTADRHGCIGTTNISCKQMQVRIITRLLDLSYVRW